MSGPVQRIKVCPNEGEPVIFTFEFPGAEYVCMTCGWLGGILDTSTVPVTRELRKRHEELSFVYARGRAGRMGLPTPQRPPQDVPAPQCRGCGVDGDPPYDAQGKPAHWYARTVDGVTEYACSRDCISSGTVAPW